jgi:hypothetical protein
MKNYLISIALIISFSACKKSNQWTIQTEDTKITFGLDSANRFCIYELSNPTDKYNWTKSPSVFPLMNKVDLEGQSFAPNWVFKSGAVEGLKFNIIFTNENPAMELTSVWEAHKGPGPVRYTMFLKNNSGRMLTIYEQESLELSVSEPNETKVITLNDDGSIVDTVGFFKDELIDGYKKKLIITESQDYIPFITLDANSAHGLYLGWEWSIGRMNIEKLAGAKTKLNAGNRDDFKTDIYAGETFEVPPGFIGTYHGDLDEAGNSLRKYLFAYSMPDYLKNDASYPKVEWNAFAATGKTHGGWDPVEKKYYPFIDDIAPLGFEEVVIDVGWWQFKSDMPEFKSGFEKRTQDMKRRQKDLLKWINKANKDDLGMKEKWFASEFKTDGWRTVNVPTFFSTLSLSDFDGIIWFKRDIEIPADFENKEATLSLGQIDDGDGVWINGVKVGSTTGLKAYFEKRNYKIPAGIIKKGINTISIRVIDWDGEGGFLSKLELISGINKLSLNGDWKMKQSYDFASQKEYAKADWDILNPYTSAANYNDPGHTVTDPIDWPSGMAAAVKYAQDKGIRFGLYDNEAENLTNEAGKAERISDITYLFKDLKADFYRSDATAGPVLKGAFGKDERAHYPEDADYWTTKGLYQVLDSLAKTIPNFQWENCSGGGRIKDYGTLKRASKIQSQDLYYPILSRQSFYDGSFALHPMQIAALNGSWCDLGGTYGCWQAEGVVYEFRSTAMGAAYWHPDAPNGGNGGKVWPAEQRAVIKKAVTTYKEKLRPLIRTANLYHIFPRPDDKIWDGLEYFDPTTKKGVVYIFKPNSTKDSEVIKLKGLDVNTSYKLTFEDGSNPETSLKGSELMEKGITVSLKGQFNSELMFINGE